MRLAFRINNKDKTNDKVLGNSCSVVHFWLFLAVIGKYLIQNVEVINAIHLSMFFIAALSVNKLHRGRYPLLAMVQNVHYYYTAFAPYYASYLSPV